MCQNIYILSLKPWTIFVAVHTTSTDVIIKAKKNVKHPYIFWPNQRMEMTVVVNVGEDAAVGDINGISYI